MAKDDDTNESIPKRPPPTEADTLPRVKLPESLQKQVDDEETLLDQIYDGTYA